MIPWLSLSILPVLAISIVKGSEYLISNVTAILVGNSFWYMPCCIIAEIIFYFVVRFTSNDLVEMGVVLILSAIGIVLIQDGFLDFLMINRAISVQLFLFIGRCIRKNEGIFDKANPKLWKICFAAYVLLGVSSVCVYPGDNLDVHQGIYYNVGISFLMIIIGCCLLFALGKHYNFNNRILVFIGQNTLVFYIWANYPITIYNELASRLHISINNVFLAALIKTAFVCCLCAAFSALINRFIPEVAGKRRIR